MIHLACIVDGGGRPGASDEASPELVVALSDGLACVARWCAEAPLTDAASLVEHDRLVQRWMRACGSVVPFRYGTVVPDIAGLHAELAPRLAEFRHLLARLRGQVELALRVAGSPDSSPAWPDDVAGQRTGRSYLRSLEAGQPRPPLQYLHGVLADFASAAVVEPDGQGGIKAAYLVPSTEVDDFCRLLEGAVARTEALGAVSLTGPWAPYSFTSMDDDRPLAAVGGARRGRDA